MVVSESNRYCLYACMLTSLLLVFGFVENCSSSAVDDPDQIGSIVDMSIHNNGTERETMRKQQASCRTGNPIDDCWRCDPNWFNNRKRLADCAIGFGKNAKGGRDGRFYVVSDSSDNDAVNPRPGTLRHAVIQIEPLWIVFARDMLITLKQELIMNSFKTIDGRGVNVQIAYGAGITIQYVTNIIIHGVHIHHCKPTGNAMVRSSPSHFGRRGMADGDAISIFGSKNIWIDHNSLSNCYDGLVDVVEASTAVTVSNNLFTDHDKVMLLGHNDAYTQDKVMQVTVAYNRFGQGLGQRMPHCRHGSFHVLNNDYPNGWGVYAIGGAANPTINSQGNRFYADAVKHPYTNQVTKRISGSESEWKRWNWRSSGDVFLNGAYFVPSGDASRAAYVKASSTLPKPASMVEVITADAGVLSCRRDHLLIFWRFHHYNLSTYKGLPCLLRRAELNCSYCAESREGIVSVDIISGHAILIALVAISIPSETIPIRRQKPQCTKLSLASPATTCEISIKLSCSTRIAAKATQNHWFLWIALNTFFFTSSLALNLLKIWQMTKLLKMIVLRTFSSTPKIACPLKWKIVISPLTSFLGALSIEPGRPALALPNLPRTIGYLLWAYFL